MIQYIVLEVYVANSPVSLIIYDCASGKYSVYYNMGRIHITAQL